MMKYSFIIPTYNNEVLLKNALVALNQLTPVGREDYEVIVVDDGSQHEVYNFIKDTNKSYPLKYIYVERGQDSSRAKARNKGLEKAEGHYVVFIDADIIVKHDFLEELDRCYTLNKKLIVAGTRILMQEPVETIMCEGDRLFDAAYLKIKHASKEFREDVFRDLSYNAATMNNPFLFCFTCNLSMPRDEIEQVGGFDEALKKWGVEDVELVYRLFQKGIKIVFNYRNEVVHQFHGIKQGKFVKKEQEAEVDYNSAIFSQKHVGAMGLSAEGIKELFRSIATKYKEMEKEIAPNENCIQIDFKEIAQLEKIKEIIKNLSTMQISHLMIYDYVECTDLDIWVQLQETFGRVIKYYPVSKLS